MEKVDTIYIPLWIKQEEQALNKYMLNNKINNLETFVKFTKSYKNGYIIYWILQQIFQSNIVKLAAG